MNNKLDLSIGILSWGSPLTLENTLFSYKFAGLLDMAKDVNVFLQEWKPEERQICDKYGVDCILSDVNIGIGGAILELTRMASSENVLFLENDWAINADETTTRSELEKGLLLLNKGINIVKYRHRKYPGDPLYTRQYAGREQDSWKHLLDCVHWRAHPDEAFPDKISQDAETGYYVTTSEYANFTNNPIMYNKDFYLDAVTPFIGGGIDLEGKIQEWWENQSFLIAHGGGLFTHKRIDR